MEENKNMEFNAASENVPNMEQNNVEYSAASGNVPNMAQNNMGYNVVPENAEKKNIGFAVASMVLGICSLVFCCCLWFLSIPCAIVGVCLAGMSLRQNRGGKGMAVAGLVTSIVAIAFLVISLIAAASMGNTINNSLWSEMMKSI